jgi:hypothetical protein
MTGWIREWTTSMKNCRYERNWMLLHMRNPIIILRFICFYLLWFIWPETWRLEGWQDYCKYGKTRSSGYRLTTLLPVLHMPSNFEWMVHRCYMCVTSRALGVTPSLNRCSKPLNWAHIHARLRAFGLAGPSCGASTFVGMLLMLGCVDVTLLHMRIGVSHVHFKAQNLLKQPHLGSLSWLHTTA